MKVFSVGNEYYDRSWLVKAYSIEEAEAKVLKTISDTWGAGEAKEAEDSFYTKPVFLRSDVVESRDI